MIRRVWEDHGYLLDPHTAVAWEVAERMRGENPMLVVSTAHWAKFGVDVYKALTGTPYASELSGKAAELSGLELLSEVRCVAPHAARIPDGLAALADLPERFTEVVDAGRDGVEGAVREWLTR